MFVVSYLHIVRNVLRFNADYLVWQSLVSAEGGIIAPRKPIHASSMSQKSPQVSVKGVLMWGWLNIVCSNSLGFEYASFLHSSVLLGMTAVMVRSVLVVCGF